MKYQVGDKVKIREDLVAHNYYGNVFFVEEMNEYKGKIAIITNEDYDNRYSIDIDKNNEFTWSGEMFAGNVYDDSERIVTPMTVLDLLNKTNIEAGGFVVSIFYPMACFKATIGHNYIRRDSKLYKRFIKAYGDMIVDEVDIKADDNSVEMIIKVDEGE